MAEESASIVVHGHFFKPFVLPAGAASSGGSGVCDGAGAEEGAAAPPQRASKDKRQASMLTAVTANLVSVYAVCSRDFSYSLSNVPRRVLTKLTQGVHNAGWDNAEHDYICRVGDQIANENPTSGRTYEILDWLGAGTFGQVLKCRVVRGGADSAVEAPVIALKIIKNKPAYFNQARVEVGILQRLNHEFDPNDEHRIIRMLDYFVFRKHLCVAFELLSMNLYDVLKQNNFRGVSMTSIRALTKQLLEAMRCLKNASVIHCDLKPENVMLSSLNPLRIKLIDFGSACAESHRLHSYIQSRFYRSPEVLLGLPYTSAIDMWSLGCICAELYLGLPIFPGHSEYDQVCRIVEVLGNPPAQMLTAGTKTKRYFRRFEEPADSSGSGDRTALVDGAPSATTSGTEGDRALEPALRALGEAPEAASQEGAAPAAPPAAAEAAGGTAAPGAAPAPAPAPPGEGHGADAPAASAEELAADHPAAGAAAAGATALGLSSAGGTCDSGRGGSAAAVSTAASVESAGGRPSSAADAPWASQPSGGEEPPSGEGSVAPSGGACSAEPVDAAPSPGGFSAASGGAVQLPPLAGAAGLPASKRRQRRSRCARTAWRVKTVEEYEKSESKKVQAPKKYFKFSSLQDLVGIVQFKANLSIEALKQEQERRHCFHQFLQGVLQINPEDRWTPKQAMQHTFVNPEVPFDPNWRPPLDDGAPTSTWAPGAMWSGSACPSASSACSSSEAAVVGGSRSSGAERSWDRRRRGGRGGWASSQGGWTPQSSTNGFRPAPASSTTVTPSSSPQGSLRSAAMFASGTAGAASSCGAGRNSSPWHLPSPMSEQSTGTASERMLSSHEPGSDSCGEHLSRGSVSQSDTSGAGWPRFAQLSDSDGASAGCTEEQSGHGRGAHMAKEPVRKQWKNIKSLPRAELARLPRGGMGMDPAALSPGGASGGMGVGVGSFRDAFPMSKSGPVIPPRTTAAPAASGSSAAAAAGGGGSGCFSSEEASAAVATEQAPPMLADGRLAFGPPSRATSSDNAENSGGGAEGQRPQGERARRRTG